VGMDDDTEEKEAKAETIMFIHTVVRYECVTDDVVCRWLIELIILFLIVCLIYIYSLMLS
jgi:hypothetical protein